MLVSIFLPWWTGFVSGFGASTFAGIWLFGTVASGSSLGVGITQGAFTSEFVVAIIFVVLSGALGIASSTDRKFSLAGGALGLFGALVFLLRLGDISTGMPGSVFFGAESVLGISSIWFLSIGFWLAIASSIIMLLASPTIHEEPVIEKSKPSEEPAPLPAALIPPPETLGMDINYCSNCGTRLEPGAKFCRECGMSTSKDMIEERPEKKRVKIKRKAKTTR
jgi:ribosomal protein L40E